MFAAHIELSPEKSAEVDQFAGVGYGRLKKLWRLCVVSSEMYRSLPLIEGFSKAVNFGA